MAVSAQSGTRVAVPAVVFVVVLAFMFGIIVGMLMSKEDIRRAYDMGVRKGDTQGYWRAQGEHGVY